MDSPTFPFVTYLENLRDGDPSSARAALATLRRALGREPGEDANLLRYVVPFLPPESSAPWAERPYFLIAPLFALHPTEGGSGNMGSHFVQVQQGKQNVDAIERRFTALLATHDDDLPYHLRQAVSLCKANNVSIDWHQLFRDVKGWGHPERWVQRRWANSFWGRGTNTPTTETSAS